MPCSFFTDTGAVCEAIGNVHTAQCRDPIEQDLVKANPANRIL